MQKSYLRLFAVLLLFSIMTFTTSCSDNDDDHNDANKTDLLVGKQWYPTRYEEEDEGKVIDVTTSWLRDCQKDDYLFFEEKGIFMSSSGNIQCGDNSGADLDGEGTWSWKNDNKVLSMVWPIVTIDQEVLSLSATELQVRYEITNGPNPADKGFLVTTYNTRN
ncbi:hypothetical protein KK062_05540 [Fulvivirgaceae bacterium PWU5]|uniref:Lipocalin-like domain-containing protein n=1 Tax=Dawidia cretensis TaxID=2782350 RepID=A0AAP2DX70_9BACT|nr:hypothetical protein [Dawidia cretensis]MBT1707672.1 hypothetical protein [Dawidia cretensis]